MQRRKKTTICNMIVVNSLILSGKPADDDVKLGDLKLKPNTKIMMMGSREESLVGNTIDFSHIFLKAFL